MRAGSVTGSTLFGVLLSGAALSGCVDPDAPREPEPEVAELAIDADAELELAPGDGVLVGVEYTTGGTWRVSAVCDTAYSDRTCSFDIIVDSGSDDGILEVARLELEDADRIIRLDSHALELDWVTGRDVDSMSFTAPPGSSVRVSVALFDPLATWWGSWDVDPRLLSWVGEGAAHWGAPTDPVDLTPATP
ncbi:MAG: hypothetical protein ABW217_15390 [Polyangiaceae bacterium]